MELTNRVVVLTGASRGIGPVIATHLARRGARLVLSARGEEGLKATAEQVAPFGREAIVVPGDVTSADDRARLLDAARAVGPIAALVNNAGIEVPQAVVDTPESDILKQIAVNLTAPLLLTRAVLPEMVEQGEGVVVMVSSMSGKSPTPYNAIYTATKHGVNGFAASVRLELEGTGVHVGTVCPSFVSEAGMWADTGLAAPAMMQEVSPIQVADAVIAVIDGKAEVLVTPMPVRPMLALGQLFPAIDGFLLKRLGVMSTLQERARTPEE